jgi:hypothetical protein
MAYLYRRRDGRIEIREARATPRGPRSRTLASFRGTLTPEILERAEARATRPLDRPALAARARQLGVPLTTRRGDHELRALLACLRRGEAIDPVLAGLLRGALEGAPVAPVPERLAEVAEWIGASDAERGEALRGLLRVSDRIVTSRSGLRRRRRRRYPRFASQPADAA